MGMGGGAGVGEGAGVGVGAGAGAGQQRFLHLPAPPAIVDFVSSFLSIFCIYNPWKISCCPRHECNSLEEKMFVALLSAFMRPLIRSKSMDGYL
jgi:hypothetical protein